MKWSSVCLALALACCGTPGGDATDGNGGDGTFVAEKQHSLDVINALRATKGLTALTLDASALSDYALVGTQQFSAGGQPHAHFQANAYPAGYGGARAENQGLANGFGSVGQNIDQILQSMWAEGPGPPLNHYDNIVGAWITVGVGVVVDGDHTTWTTHDFH
jgi:uncharacterized protein YkwD